MNGNSNPQSETTGWQLAQINIGRMIAAQGDVRVQPFFDALDRVNAMADCAPGFVWRLQSEAGNATDLQPTPDPLLIVNMSIWTNADALFDFVYRSGHTPEMARRREYFAKFEGAYQALWWVQAGHHPSIEEGLSRLWMIDRFGPSATAFTFKVRFPEPTGHSVDRLPDPRCVDLASVLKRHHGLIEYKLGATGHKKVVNLAEKTGVPKLARMVDTAPARPYRVLPWALIATAIGGMWTQIMGNILGYAAIIGVFCITNFVQIYGPFRTNPGRWGRWRDEREKDLFRRGHLAGLAVTTAFSLIGCFYLGFAMLNSELQDSKMWIPAKSMDWICLGMFLLVIELNVAILAASHRMPHVPIEEE